MSRSCTDLDFWNWQPFRDHTEGGDYADWSVHRDGLALWSHTDAAGVQWFKLHYDNEDKNGYEFELAPETDLEFNPPIP